MKIVVDEEAKQHLHELCDLCFRTTGMSNLGAVTKLLNAIEVEDVKVAKKESKKPTKPKKS